LIDAIFGAGLVFMSFLAAIPGLLPAVILTALLLAPLLIPPLLVGAIAALLLGVVRVAAWALAFAATLIARAAPARRTVSPSPENTRGAISPLVHTGP
jgi:hypothetical protein